MHVKRTSNLYFLVTQLLIRLHTGDAFFALAPRRFAFPGNMQNFLSTVVVGSVKARQQKHLFVFFCAHTQRAQLCMHLTHCIGYNPHSMI